MKFRELEKIINADGWQLDRVNGSHHQYLHPTKKGLVTIPFHGGDVPKVVVKNVLQQAKLK